MKQDKFNFRIATINDVRTLAKHRIKFLNEVFDLKTHPDSEQLEIELIDFFYKSINDNSLVAWIAEYENQIISTSSLVIWKAPLSYSGLGLEGKRGYILNMYTLNEFRKKGVSSLLLEKLIDEAKKMKLEFVNLHATEDGISLYKKIGFKEPKFPELKLKIESNNR